jgi:hypothetical protein
MEKHVTLVGSLHIGYSALQILLALTGVVLVIGAGMIGGLISEEGIVFTITFVVGAIISLWILLVSLPSIVGGVALLRYKPWGRYLVLVLSVLALFSIPLGTAIGAYSIWVLLQDEAAELFAGRSSS